MVHFVPKGLSTVAVASDRIIEGLEDQTHPFFLQRYSGTQKSLPDLIILSNDCPMDWFAQLSSKKK